MAVEVGDMAPDFTLPSHHGKGKKVRLQDFRGKKNVMIAFYPLAWTPV
jgi:peroxiredoxin